MNSTEWSIWLRQFSAELIDGLDLDQSDAFRHDAVDAARVASGWLGEAGLDETELARLETRLAGIGTRIPRPLRSGPGSPEARLADCLLISQRELVGTAVFLLNPSVRHAGGEWEALRLAHWIPGANRYRSFQELLEQERQAFLKRDETARQVDELRPKRVSVLRELWRVLRGPGSS